MKYVLVLIYSLLALAAGLTMVLFPIGLIQEGYREGSWIRFGLGAIIVVPLIFLSYGYCIGYIKYLLEDLKPSK